MLEFSRAAQALRFLVNQNVGSNFVKNRCHLQRCMYQQLSTKIHSV